MRKANGAVASFAATAALNRAMVAHPRAMVAHPRAMVAHPRAMVAHPRAMVGQWSRTPGQWSRTPGQWSRTPGQWSRTPGQWSRTPGQWSRRTPPECGVRRDRTGDWIGCNTVSRQAVSSPQRLRMLRSSLAKSRRSNNNPKTIRINITAMTRFISFNSRPIINSCPRPVLT
ncbi:hypothetical protein EDC14_1014128 [Hydrogenispora ethanolica]|uniref:Uncharacterized protein n=1 Tax=Hydrogenispora ethanolica TaxID=1082276 RepID=A0A4R1RME4_HYDET|nr:hypothetical protein EDC14_1014128 [Hydrogenispora ethanolica]